MFLILTSFGMTTGFILLYIFAFFALIQLFYFLFFFSRVPLFKNKNLKNPEVNKPISIIVCALNEEANLRKNLPSLLSQNYFKNGIPYFEVLVVNDNSEDNTFYLLNEMKEEYKHLHVLHLTQTAKLIPGKKFALSMGIKSAKYEHLLLTDADCVPASSEWLAKMASHFSDEKNIVLGYGAYNKYPGILNKKIRFETIHSAMQFFSFALAKIPYMGVGRNLAYTRTLFVKNKGFASHHHIVSGDDDLFINQVANKKNVAIELSAESFTYSEPKKNKSDWSFQKRRHLGTGKFYKLKHKILLGFYAMTQLLFFVSFIASLFFIENLIFAIPIFLIREMVMYFVYLGTCKKLKENDLIPYIFLFDFWLIFYHYKNFKTITIKTHQHWK